MELSEKTGGVAEAEVAYCQDVRDRYLDFDDREPNAETLDAFAEIERMEADPSLGKSYATVEELFAEILSDV
jgi:hypothetical protein